MYGTEENNHKMRRSVCVMCILSLLIITHGMEIRSALIFVISICLDRKVCLTLPGWKDGTQVKFSATCNEFVEL